MKLKISILLIVLLVSACTINASCKLNTGALPEKKQEVSLAEIETLCREYGRVELWERIKASPPPKPFRSDGCSMFPDDIKGIYLYPSCFFHDLEYWVGGSETDRLIADALLMIDVAKLGNPKLAELMFNAVRLGGTDKLATSWRWGFGWPHE